MEENEEELKARENEEEEQKIHESASNRVNDDVNRVRNLNKIKNAAKTGRGGAGVGAGEGAAAEGAGAAGAALGGEAAVGEGGAVLVGAGTSPAWGTAAIIIFLILLIIFLVVLIFMVIFGGVKNVNAGIPQDCTAIGGTCGTSCQSPNILDTTGASCDSLPTGQTQVCCVPAAQPPAGDCAGLDNTTDGTLCWATKINSTLELARNCSNDIYNRQQKQISNATGYNARIRAGSCNGLAGSTYFCTNLVGDSYNLAGIKKNFNQYVPSMMSQWNSVSGLHLSYANNVRLLKPGDAVFWHNPSKGRFAHTDIIYSINVNSTTGDGTLYTIDANVNIRRVKNYVRNWKLLGTVWLPQSDGIAFGWGPR